ncbi:hypothetical protein E2562_017171 [Oryza meyeriana var. granulata]|uniref:SUI1 domain-containing protein n=1 Tax=Oryza meyeriana var. granulata TaxID=110450 RepID=A0A6G1EL54_9ORYZ|nr:hypothetical protein E2562_017171 [Oryza meyeriana var. granulata]
MRVKRRSKHRKVVKFYATCFGFHEPYRVLVDGTSVHHRLLPADGALQALLSASRPPPSSPPSASSPSSGASTSPTPTPLRPVTSCLNRDSSLSSPAAARAGVIKDRPTHRRPTHYLDIYWMRQRQNPPKTTAWLLLLCLLAKIFLLRQMLRTPNTGPGAKDYVRVCIHQCNGRKSLTIVQGLKEFSYNKIPNGLKKEFCCNGTVVQDPELGQVIQLQGGQRKNVDIQPGGIHFASGVDAITSYA